MQEDQDWGFVAMVLDRIFLILFNTAFFVGTAWILFDAPALYDYSEAIDKLISRIAQKQYPQEQNAEGIWLTLNDVIFEFGVPFYKE